MKLHQIISNHNPLGICLPQTLRRISQPTLGILTMGEAHFLVNNTCEVQLYRTRLLSALKASLIADMGLFRAVVVANSRVKAEIPQG